MVQSELPHHLTSPQALLQLMKDLEQSGFHPAFTFDNGQLTMFIRRKTLTKNSLQNAQSQQRIY
jgi:hypothetical protein